MKDSESPSGTDHQGSFRVLRIQSHKIHNHSFSLRSAAGIAALVLFAVGTIYLSGGLKKKVLENRTPSARSANVYEEISTKPGEQATLTLSDGTRILLNSASRLRYNHDALGNRDFYLIGEAYFIVAPGHKAPVVVRTNMAVVRDIGTKFDVSAWPDDDQTRIAVTQGEVIVHANHPVKDRSAMVTSGQFTAVTSEGIVSSPTYTNVNRIISWTRGRLVFYNEPMSDVIKQLQRRYGIKCFLADASIGVKTLTATFDDRVSAKEVLDIIALSLKLRYKTSKDSVLFIPTKSNSM
ncbi:MAG: FecR domain-containing protein [Bacteroidetes bacterium]|nr:FecR domain-containing protein [Bacteroidota bacterium]